MNFRDDCFFKQTPLFAQSLRERTTLNKTFSIGVSHTRVIFKSLVKGERFFFPPCIAVLQGSAHLT